LFQITSEFVESHKMQVLYHCLESRICVLQKPILLMILFEIKRPAKGQNEAVQ
jgi:hypothetical protein